MKTEAGVWEMIFDSLDQIIQILRNQKSRNVLYWMTAENRFKHKEIRSLDKRHRSVVVNTVFTLDMKRKEEHVRSRILIGIVINQRQELREGSNQKTWFPNAMRKNEVPIVDMGRSSEQWCEKSLAGDVFRRQLRFPSWQNICICMVVFRLVLHIRGWIVLLNKARKVLKILAAQSKKPETSEQEGKRHNQV